METTETARREIFDRVNALDADAAWDFVRACQARQFDRLAVRYPHGHAARRAAAEAETDREAREIRGPVQYVEGWWGPSDAAFAAACEAATQAVDDASASALAGHAAEEHVTAACDTARRAEFEWQADWLRSH